MKGVLWQQREKRFSRWKERFFVISNDYLQCYRKGTSKISEMGGFIYRIRLSEVSLYFAKRSLLTPFHFLRPHGKVLISSTTSKIGAFSKKGPAWNCAEYNRKHKKKLFQEYFFSTKSFFVWQIEQVELIERRGYLTLRLSLPKEGGKLLLRKTDGIRKWFLTLQVSD